MQCKSYTELDKNNNNKKRDKSAKILKGICMLCSSNCKYKYITIRRFYTEESTTKWSETSLVFKKCNEPEIPVLQKGVTMFSIRRTLKICYRFRTKKMFEFILN